MAIVLARALEPLLFSVDSADPVTFIVATTAPVVAVVLATWLPARRGSRIDPLQSLQGD